MSLSCNIDISPYSSWSGRLRPTTRIWDLVGAPVGFLHVHQHTPTMMPHLGVSSKVSSRCHCRNLLGSSVGMHACPWTSVLAKAWLKRLPTFLQLGKIEHQFRLHRNNPWLGSILLWYVLCTFRTKPFRSSPTTAHSYCLGKQYTRRGHILGTRWSISSKRCQLAYQQMILVPFL